MPMPGINAVAGFAMRGIGAGLNATVQLVSLPTRVLGIVERTESVLTQVEVVVRRVDHVSLAVETLAERAGEIVGEIRGVVGKAQDTMAGIEPLLARTAATMEQAALFAQHAETLTARAGELIGEGERLLGEVGPVVERALPPARKFVEQLSVQEVAAAIAMVDELPELAHRMRNDIVPILATLDGVAPNVAELVKLTDDVRQAILGIPGFGRLRRRGAEKIEEEEAEEAKELEAKKSAAKKIEAPADPQLF